MKILKTGTKLDEMAEKIFISECWRCGCVFSFKGNEVNFYDNIKTPKKNFVHCPQCKATITEWKEDIS